LREEFIEQLEALPPESVIYIDECGIDNYLYREFAYAPRGEKVISKISGKKFKRTNLVAGICQGEWIAPMEYEGTTDSILFEYWFENCLLKQAKCGSVIVLDNATFHKKSILPNLARQYGCSVLFLPPYSPDLNPIEHKWAWLKKRLRKTLRFFDSFQSALWDSFNVA